MFQWTKSNKLVYWSLYNYLIELANSRYDKQQINQLLHADYHLEREPIESIDNIKKMIGICAIPQL